MSVKFNKNFLNKNLYTKKISIDSHDRDRNYIPSYRDTDSPNDYKISLEKFDELRKNIVGISLVSACIPNTEFIINENNNKLDVLYNGNIYCLKLTPNHYTSISNFATELNIQLTTTIPTGGFAASKTSNSNTITITSTNNFTFLFETGNNSNFSIQEVLGFGYKDIESSSNSLTTGMINIASNRYVDIVIEEIPRIGLINTTKENENHILERVYLENQHGEYKIHYVNDYDRIYNFFNGIELSNLSIKLLNDKNKIYDSNHVDNVITLEFILLKDNTPDNLYINPSSTDTLLLKYFKAFLIDKKSSDQKMKDYMTSINQNNKQLLNAFMKNLDEKKFKNDDIINIVNVIKENEKLTNKNNIDTESINNNIEAESMNNHIDEDSVNNINDDLINEGFMNNDFFNTNFLNNQILNNDFLNNIFNGNTHFINLIIILIILLFLFNLFKKR